MSPSLSIRGESLAGQGPLLELMHDISQHIQEWDADKNPDGLISVAGASNFLMDDWIRKYCSDNFGDVKVSDHLHYGPDSGSSALRTAMANFFNRYFAPAKSIKSNEILVTNGSSSLIENLAWNLFNPGDTVLMPTPNYALFRYNFEGRPGVRILRVSMTGVEDQFAKEFAGDVVREFEKTYTEAKSQGILVKGVLLCNPHNPLGRCYSRQTLLDIARFCHKRGLHLISDEVYAMSCFSKTGDDTGIGKVNKGITPFDGFTSALAIPDGEEYGNGDNIHVMYSTSKDFGMAGLRLGFLVTRNEKLRTLMEKLGNYSWVTASSDAFFTRLISDHKAIDEYFDTQRDRLGENFIQISALLKKHEISFSPVNSGLFVWIDLSKYLKYFKGDDESEEPLHPEKCSREMKICRYLIDNGILLSPGEMSESPLPGYFRFTITTGSKIVEIAVQRLAVALKALEIREVKFGIEGLSVS